MFIPPHKTFEELSRPAAQAFRFWISFWPTAPMFGVEWRFADVARTVAPLPPGRPATELRAVAKAQKRAAEAVVEAPAVAAPVSEEALESHPAMAEPAIERTLEPEAPETQPEPEEAQPEVATGETAERNLTLDPEPGDGAPERPKGLLKAPPKQVDDLKLIKGIGPGLEGQLNGLGVYKFRQIAGFSDPDLAWIDANLTSFKGRCFRDDWIGQAKALLEG